MGFDFVLLHVLGYYATNATVEIYGKKVKWWVVKVWRIVGWLVNEAEGKFQLLEVDGRHDGPSSSSTSDLKAVYIGVSG